MASGLAVGIDLGTTFSVVAVCRRGKVEVLANDDGSRTTPSVAAFLDGQSYVGQAAEEVEAPASSRVFDAKRLIGRSWDDKDVQKDRTLWPFELVEQHGAPRIKVAVDEGVRKTFAPEEFSAMVLQNLKQTAEDALGQTVTRALITVPAYFNERQRQATRDAGKIAGLDVIGMINEPTAAALAYGLDNQAAGKRTVLIFDLGGGTFDVSVMKIGGSEYTVLGSGGDTHLGGQDFDARLLDHCLKDIRRALGVDLLAPMDHHSVREVRRACELAKRKLSKLAEVPLAAFLSRRNLGYRTSITRAFFEDLCADLFEKTMAVTEQVLKDAKVSRSAVDDVVLVGGSTRIPKVRSLLQAFFGGKELRQSVNPDEAVAYGAALHAAVLSGDKSVSSMVRLKDVTPLSLGICVVGDRFSPVIPRNSPVPCKRTKNYYTTEDYQSCIPLPVYQGERPLVKDNHYLNKTIEVIVDPRPAHEAPPVAVTFEVDVNGLLTVTAVEPTTGRAVQAKITRQEAHLSDREILEMVEKAKRFQRRDNAELRKVEDGLRSEGRLR